MAVLSCKNIQKSFGVDDVLKDITFLLEEGEKAAIVGVNGAGKTTLLKIITGELQRDGGEITFKKGARIGYLSQMMGVSAENTVEEELATVFERLINTEKTLRNLEHEMKTAAGCELDALMERYAVLSRYFEENRGYEYESRLRGMIKGLGFTRDEAERKIAALSGGQKTRVALGKLLLDAPDILLLDEPTNHLDIESVQWLEDTFLRGYEGSVIVVSHDRYFLDKTVTKVIEIENGKSEVYFGNYSYFIKKKTADREIELKHYIDQQKEIKRQEEVIKRLKSFNREKSIRAAESKEKRLAKMERVEKPEDEPDKIWIRLKPRKQSGNDVLTVKDLKKSFPDGDLFENVSFEIKRGEKVALIGANGIGKTTLFKMLLDGGYERNIKLGANVEVGYFDQEHQTLDEGKSMFDDISDTYPQLKILEIRDTLAAFVFTGDEVYKVISSLSGGEKGRVALAKLMLSNSNFLLLDEPTNHLDMYSRDVLENALNSYEGTVLYISHDRYFINNTADKVLEMDKSGVIQYLGNYDYYAEKRVPQNFEPEPEGREMVTRDIASGIETTGATLGLGLGLELGLEARVEGGEPAAELAVDGEPRGKDDWKRRKDKQSAERRRLARIERIEKEIAEIDGRIAELDALSLLEEVYTDAEKSNEVYREKKVLEDKLDGLYQEWHEIEES